MARIQLQVDDPANRVVLHTMLQTAGHEIVSEQPDALITDRIENSPALAENIPTLVLASAMQIRAAVNAMQKGVFGYIFLPFQPGEAEIMIRRALGAETAPIQTDTRPLHEVEADQILAVLRQCKGNRAKTARVLGIGRNTLWRKLKEIETRRGGTGTP